MSVYIAKGLGFGLAWYAKRSLGACPNSLLRFKLAEFMALIGAEILITAATVAML